MSQPSEDAKEDSETDQTSKSRRNFLRTAAVAAGGLIVGGALGAYAGPLLARSSQQSSNSGGLTKGNGTFKIGTSVSTSGPTAPAISKEVDMLNAWAQMINARGGIYAPDMGGYIPVEVDILQDGGPADLGTVKNNYIKMCTTDKCDLVLGPFAAALAETAVPVAIQYGVPYIDTNAGEIPIFTQNSNLVVGTINLINYWLYNYFSVLKNQTTAKTIALIDTGDDFSTEVDGTGPSSFGATTFAQQFGFDVVTNGSDHVNTNFSSNFDYTAEVQRMKSLDPDVICFTETTGVFQGQFWLACKQAGYKPRAYHPIFATYASFQGVVGSSMLNGLSGDVEWTPSLPYEGLWGKTFWSDLQTKANFTFSQWSSLIAPYTGLEVACAAVQYAGSTNKTDVANALNTMQIDVLNGPWEAQNPLKLPFPPPSGLNTGHGMALFVQIPVQILNGQTNIIGPPDIATAAYQYPQPAPF